MLNRVGPATLSAVFMVAVVLQLINESEQSQFFVVSSVCLIVATVMLTVMQFFNTLGINYRSILVLSIYHVLIAWFNVAIIAPNDPMYFIWLIAIFRSDYIHGRYGTMISVAIAISVAAINLVTSESNIQSHDVINLIEQSVILTAVATLVTGVREITEKERKVLLVSMDRAQLERQRLLSLINSMADAVIATDEDGTIRLYNGATLEVLDTNESLEGQKIQRYLNLYDPNGAAVDIIKSASESKTSIRRTDLSLRYSLEDKMSLYISVAPIKLGFRSNSERGFIMILRDITKEKSLEEERDEFISVVSHELRTPVTISEAEISNAELINTKQVKNDVIGKALESAHKQIIFLSHMINDLATLSRAKHDDLDMELSIIEPAEILKGLEENYRHEAQQKGLKLEVEVVGSVHTVVSSKLYVEEILQNFITNSLKYTKSGSIRIIAEQAETGILFKVTDTGIGISTADQKKLFAKFFRSEDYRTRESSGTGLGLYVTLKLAKKIGGKISVDSEINKGSTFSILVPSKQKQNKHELTQAQVDAFIDSPKPKS